MKRAQKFGALTISIEKDNPLPGTERRKEKNVLSAFTLIELSIVLVIIGLIIGGVLTGNDLIHAAGVRATVSQIERYNTAVNTFKGKYGYLPGDIKDPDASNFGFIHRGSSPGQGDGNGIIEGSCSNAGSTNFGYCIGSGENGVFWTDLSTARMIDGNYTSAVITIGAYSLPLSAQVDKFMPAAKLGGASYIYVWSGGYAQGDHTQSDGTNYFGISGISYLSGSVPSNAVSLSVRDANDIDTKIDDGLPQTGRVVANVWQTWAAGGASYSVNNGASDTSATPASATTCYDNGNVSGTQHYSMSQSKGSNINCLLSLRFQ